MDALGKYLLSALIGAMLMAIALLNIAYIRHKPEEQKVVRDTVIFHDTVRFDVPVPKKITVRDTVYIALDSSNTTKKNDSTYIALQNVTKVYSDSSYTLQISGYQPALDWIEVYPTRIVVTEKVFKDVYKKTRWGIGIQAGYGASIYNSKVVLTPYVGVGISYNFIRW